jgi:argininosuccinate lyase
VRAARDKSHQREVLAGAGFATPVFRVVEDVPSAITAARMTGFPVVLKPVDGTGSMGVRACVAERDVEVHAGLLFGRSNGSRTRLLVESFIEGEEFSVEVFSGRVVGITRKHLGDWPYFVESGHDYPAVLSASAAREISQTARSASNLLGLCWGPLHWEVRMQRGRAVVVEVNPRLAGGFIPELVRYAQGIDLIRATLRLVTGQRPELEPERHQSASIRFLMAPRAGIFVAAKGIGAAQSVPGVVDVRLYRAPGDELELQGDFRDRIGHVMASGDLPNVTSSAAEQARRMIRLRVEDTSKAR